MYYAIRCNDKPNALELRIANREAHLAYVTKTDCVAAAGPILADDEATMIGSIIIINVSSMQAAQEWAENDPYNQAGLFQQVEINAWNWVIGAPAN